MIIFSDRVVVWHLTVLRLANIFTGHVEGILIKYLLLGYWRTVEPLYWQFLYYKMQNENLWENVWWWIREIQFPPYKEMFIVFLGVPKQWFIFKDTHLPTWKRFLNKLTNLVTSILITVFSAFQWKLFESFWERHVPLCMLWHGTLQVKCSANWIPIFWYKGQRERTFVYYRFSFERVLL